MCTVCPVIHCIGNHLNALHLNDSAMSLSFNSELSNYGNHDDDGEEEADDLHKGRSKLLTVDAETSDKSQLIKRRKQFYYNHVQSTYYSQILPKKISNEQKTNSSSSKLNLLTVPKSFNQRTFA